MGELLWHCEKGCNMTVIPSAARDLSWFGKDPSLRSG